MALPQSLLDGTTCFTCLGISLGDALFLALWTDISESAGGGGGGETFHLLWNVGDNVLIPQVGDRFIYQ